jgi:hypothetical protein
LRELVEPSPCTRAWPNWWPTWSWRTRGRRPALDALGARVVDEAVEEPIRWQAAMRWRPVTREARLPRVIFTR